MHPLVSPLTAIRGRLPSKALVPPLFGRYTGYGKLVDGILLPAAGVSHRWNLQEKVGRPLSDGSHPILSPWTGDQQQKICTVQLIYIHHNLGFLRFSDPFHDRQNRS